MRLIFLLLVVATAACKKDEMTPAVCENEAHRFGNWLKALPKASNLEPTVPVVTIAGGQEPPPFVDAHYVVIDKRSISLHGDVIAEAGGSFEGFADDLADALNTRNEQRRLLGESEVHAVMVAAAPDAPWSLVGATLTALGAIGQRDVGLVFQRKGIVRPPPRSSITKKIEQILAEGDPSQKATQMAAVVTDVIKGCPAAQRRFGEMAMMSPGEKEEHLRLEIPKAFVECQCHVDLEAAQTAFHALVAPRVGVVLEYVKLGDGGAAVALPGATPWSEAHAKVITTPGRTVTVQVL